MGPNLTARSPGLWVGQGFWTETERKSSNTLRELRAVRRLLSKSFAD